MAPLLRLPDPATALKCGTPEGLNYNFHSSPTHALLCLGFYVI